MPDSILKQKFVKAVATNAREWLDPQPAWLGNRAGTVLTETQGIFYARLSNGKVVRVHNTAGVPPTYDLHVTIGRTKNLLKIWQIMQVEEDFDTPAASGQITYHHLQHMWGAGDMIPVDRRQITSFTIIPSSGYIVMVYGGTIRVVDTFVTVPSQLVDLTAYVVTAGAKFVNVEYDDTGALSYQAGTVFGSPLIATAANIPVPATGKNLLGSVLMYEGQTSVGFDDIFLIAPSDKRSVAYFDELLDVVITTPAAGQVITYNGTSAMWENAAAPEARHIIMEEGVALTSRPTLNFIGPGVTAADNSGSNRTDVTIRTIPLKIVMDPTLVNPPVPVSTPGGDDYVYYEV